MKPHPITPRPTDPEHWGLRDCTAKDCAGRPGFYCTTKTGGKRPTTHACRLKMPSVAWKTGDQYIRCMLARGARQ